MQEAVCGETQNPLHICLNGHDSDIENNRTEKTVAAHFRIPGHSLRDLTILVSRKDEKLGPWPQEEEGKLLDPPV